MTESGAGDYDVNFSVDEETRKQSELTLDLSDDAQLAAAPEDWACDGTVGTVVCIV